MALVWIKSLLNSRHPLAMGDDRFSNRVRNSPNNRGDGNHEHERFRPQNQFENSRLASSLPKRMTG